MDPIGLAIIGISAVLSAPAALSSTARWLGANSQQREYEREASAWEMRARKHFGTEES
jgi:hypothetical protein